MKYMGSKQSMLKNGLGQLILDRAGRANRIVDLFSGSGVVAWFAAENTKTPVFAFDLQEYAAILARSVVERTRTLDSHALRRTWFEKTRRVLNSHPLTSKAVAHQKATWSDDPEGAVSWAQDLCNADGAKVNNVCSAYGGHYYSPLQAIQLDALRASIPDHEPVKSALLAALISAAYMCVAAPGHTAQPFKPTPKGSPHLFKAWRKDPFHYCSIELERICRRASKVAGEAKVGNALDVSRDVCAKDLVILDPPYSFVHYSRFYHVLETVANGYCGPVEGIGRYPPLEERPTSTFSIRTRSEEALRELLERLSMNKAAAILTFPSGESSNGLTGDRVLEIAGRFYEIERQTVNGRFSTLGGDTNQRPARMESRELLLFLRSS